MNHGGSGSGGGGANHPQQQHRPHSSYHQQTHQNNQPTAGVGPAQQMHHGNTSGNTNSNSNSNSNSNNAKQMDDEFGGLDIDWTSIPDASTAAAATTATTTTATAAASSSYQPNANARTRQQTQQGTAVVVAAAAAQARVPAYNPYGRSTSSSSAHRGGSGQNQQQQQQQYSASSSASVGLTDGAVVMSSGGSSGGGGGTSSAAGTPASVHDNVSAAGGYAGGSASHAIDLTTDNAQGQTGGNTGTNAQEEELRRKIEQLTAQLESKDDAIFSLQMSLTSVEAEASHRTQRAESEAASRVRLVEDRLRLVQREADSARASLTRERARRGGGHGGSGGGSGGGKSTSEIMDRHHHQQQQHGGQGLQHRSDGVQNSKQPGGGKRVVTPPEQAAASANAVDGSTMMASARFRPILSSIGSSDTAPYVVAGGMQSRSQRVASQLLLKLDLIWPEEGDGAGTSSGMSAAAFMVTSGGEGGKPPQPKRQRRHGSAGAGPDGGATNTKGVMLVRSGAIHPGSREAERFKAAALRGQKEPEQSGTKGRDMISEASAANNANHSLPAGNAAGVGSQDGQERAAIRTLLTQIASWDANKAASPPPSVGALVRDLVVKITSNFDYGSGADSGAAKGGSEAEPMAVDGPTTNDSSSKPREGTSNSQNHPKILSDSSWPTMVRLAALLREVLTLSSEARDVLRSWLAQTAYPDISTSAASIHGPSIASTSKIQARISVLGSADAFGPSNNVLDRLAVDVREAVGGAASLGPTVEGNSDCWDPKSIETTCGKFRDILCGAILGMYSLGKPFDVIRQSGIGSFEKETPCLFLALMADAPSPAGCHDLGIWAVWFDELLPSAFLETSSSDPSATIPGNDLVAILEDGSDLVSGFPRRRANKKKARFFSSRHRNRRANNYVMEMKSFALQIVLRLVNCCDDTRNRWLNGDPLCRRVLAAVLDELEGSILPVMDSASANSNRRLTEHPLNFCQAATAYTSLLCRSADGFQLLRTQMTSDISRANGGHREQLSFSGIAIMTDILLSTVKASTAHNNVLNRDLVTLNESVRDDIVEFFSLVWSQVTQIRLAEGEAESDSLLSVVDERREMFIGCFSELQSARMRTTISPDTLRAVEQTMREIGYDIDEE